MTTELNKDEEQRKARVSNAPIGSVLAALRTANDRLAESLRRPLPMAPRVPVIRIIRIRGGW